MLSKEEYLQLVTRFLNEQYGDELEDSYEEEPIEDTKPPRVPDFNKIINVTTYKKAEIIDALLYCSNLQVNNFIVKISDYIKEEGQNTVKYNLKLYEESPHIYLNRPCKKTTKLIPSDDIRFSNCSWVNYFNSSSSGEKLPLEELLNLVRWLQAVSKLAAFI